MANYEFRPAVEVINTRLEMTAIAIKLNAREIFHSEINENNAIRLGTEYVCLHGLYSVLITSRNPDERFMAVAERYNKAVEEAKRGDYSGIRKELMEGVALNEKAAPDVKGALKMAGKLKHILDYIPLYAHPLIGSVVPWENPEVKTHYSIQRKFTRPDN